MKTPESILWGLLLIAVAVVIGSYTCIFLRVPTQKTDIDAIPMAVISGILGHMVPRRAQKGKGNESTGDNV